MLYYILLNMNSSRVSYESLDNQAFDYSEFSKLSYFDTWLHLGVL